MSPISKSKTLNDIEEFKSSLPSGKRMTTKDVIQIIKDEPDIGSYGEDNEMVWIHWKDNVWRCDKCGLTWVMSNDKTPEENEMNGCPKCLRKSIGIMEASDVMKEYA